MPSGEFTSFPISEITVNREGRQRQELKNIDDLADSIKRSGLINPIVIKRDGELIAGERRYTACNQLGWTSIPVQFSDEVDPIILHLIELEENTKRTDLTWQEECNAILEYERLQQELDKDWTSEDTAEALGVAKSVISQKKDVAKALEKGDEKVSTAQRYSTALGIVNRKKERDKASALAEISEDQEEVKVPLINEDFTKWISSYKGEKFNFIHCDFPYGVGINTQGWSQAKSHGSYEDSEDVYWNLLSALTQAMNAAVAESAHLMFWFSMDYYQSTLNHLTEMGWNVNPFPLIWHKSDNTGIMPDPQRGPRRIYETAFFASRGDRKVVQPIANTFAHPGKDKSIHMSEKPREMLRHFFRMAVDEYTYALDPTCGSGNSIRVAQDLGASRVLGIEKDKEFYEQAKEHYNDL